MHTVDAWIERDRASIVVYDDKGNTVFECWDDEVYGLAEAGYLDTRRLEQSALEYVRTLDIID